MGFWKEFKKFAMRGNLIDMAVGIIIGGGFGKIVTSLVNDIIMPPLGLLIGGIDFSDFKVVLKNATVDAAGKQLPAVTLNYGQFINIMISFLIVAFTVFIVVKAVNYAKQREQDAIPATPPPPPVPSAQEKLLEEIRDILKAKNS